MTTFEDLWIWREPALKRRLGWYRRVAENRLPARFRLARTIALALDPDEAAEAALWAELERLTPHFLARVDGIACGGESLAPQAATPSLLDLCRALAGRMLKHCNFCQWECGVDRSQGAKLGTCKLASETRVSTFFHHPGEELVYRGTLGSGTVFFTSCNMRCAFCQNGDISTDKDNGRPVDAETLAAMAWLLRVEGCHNINWVGGDPTIHLHTIVDAITLLAEDGYAPSRETLTRARPMRADWLHGDIVPALGQFAGGFNAPMLWNSNFFMSEETMRVLRVLIDVWLPDFKFGPGRCAIELARTPRYWETVTRNLSLIEGWGADATIRHLVMPEHVECCTYPVLEWIAENMPGVPVNVMDQYRPEMACDPSHATYRERYSALARRPSGHEVRAAYARAESLGLNYRAVTREKSTKGIHA